MTGNFKAVFGEVKPIIGMIHLGALPGTPLYDAESGLSAGFVTRGRSKIDHFITNIQVGMAQVNLPAAGRNFQTLFTGRKYSAFGPLEKRSYCREFFTAAKVAHTHYG